MTSRQCKNNKNPPLPKVLVCLIISHLFHCFGIHGDNNPQQIIDERIFFLKEQISEDNKPEVDNTFQIQIDAIRSVDDIEKVESIILQKKTLSKNSKDAHESKRLFAELDGLE